MVTLRTALAGGLTLAMVTAGCWVVEAETGHDFGSGGGLGGVHYYQRVDGTLLGEDGAVIGN